MENLENLDSYDLMNRFCGFEATPVVVFRDKRTGAERWASARCLKKATEIASRTGATVEFALFGIEPDGLRRHLGDRTSPGALRELVARLLGADHLADWTGDRVEFGAKASIVPGPL